MLVSEIFKAAVAGLSATFLLPFTTFGLLFLILSAIGQTPHIDAPSNLYFSGSVVSGLVLGFGVFFAGRWSVRLTVTAAGAAALSWIVAHTSEMPSFQILLISPMLVMMGVSLFMAFGAGLFVLRAAAVRLGIDP